MIATQYDITLPADYDMDIVRRRVATRGHALDDYAGLTLKAYLVRDRNRHAPVNSYSPFYIWEDDTVASRFHWGGEGFAGIVRDFGRPLVHVWLGADHRLGPACELAPDHAIRTVRAISAHTDPQVAADQARLLSNQILELDGVHSTAWAIDPTTWQLVRFTLLAGRPSPDITTAAEHVEEYEVLHISAPARER